MKTNIFKIVTIMLLLAGSLASCGGKSEESEPLPALKGTEWKVERIWYEESQIFEVPKIDCEKCYTLIFDADNTAHGFLPRKTFRLDIIGRKVQTDVPDSVHGKEGCDSCYYKAGIMGSSDLFFHYYTLALIAVQFHYSITETEMKLYFKEPISIADWEGLGIEKPVHAANRSILDLFGKSLER